ncbi:AMP-binding protein [Vibrio penaeicida]|uniref:Long-chain-fatty-acid--CoA ligase n=1 Tax=Vibrio penaeicida TaxID=104609 RepID=A0AAV5NZR5_9VIBR|nr:AMP-binding protein [Vibrio penaeicida]RTZ23714.1 long-chain fatty acid--CoA ligase [Vibrio penaeicida]GLQ75809.1 long-chain-fatty-acid--CoA ligase [Vibrio penaeicida]
MNSNANLGKMIELTCARFGDRVAFECQGKEITFNQVEHQSRQLAIWFQQHPELIQGDRIAIQLPNVLHYPIVAYAALRAGLVVVNTNPLYTYRELSHQLADSGAKALVVLDANNIDIEQIKFDTNVSIFLQASPVLSENSLVTPIDSAIEMASGELAPYDPSYSDICVLQYTGGTTGLAKGACLTHHGLIQNILQLSHRLNKQLNDDGEISICPLPLYHIYAFAVNMLLIFSYGGRNVLIPNPRDIDSMITAIEPHSFTMFSGINTLFVALCHHPKFKSLNFDSLKLTLSGGAALTENARKMWLDTTGKTISEGYGMSETSPVIALNEPGNEEYGTVGLPLVDTKVEIWDLNEKPLESGEVGEIVISGPQVMEGYWNRSQETEEVITSSGFFKTGDLGLIMPSGAIKIVDRLKDMILVSGFNVYPTEIEQVLCDHPSIMEAAVVGGEDPKTGEAVLAYITVSNPLTIDEVVAHCRENLTAYKVPKMIQILPELPKSTVGKILRRELRR